MPCVAERTHSALSKFTPACFVRTKVFRSAMKKLVLLSLLALVSASSTYAANSATPSRRDLVTRVESCEAILQEFMANPATAIPASILQQARALVIVNQFKAGFFLGIKDGY